MRLSKSRIAQWMGVDERRIDRLVEHSLLTPGADTRYSGDDVHTARLLLALEDAGMDLEALYKAYSEGVLDLDVYPLWFPYKPINPGRPYAEFVEDLGAERENLQVIYRTLGLAEPDPSRRIAEDEQSILWDLLEIADELGDSDLFRRLLVAFSTSALLAVERGVGLFTEKFGEPLRGRPEGELSQADVESWSQLSRMSPSLLAWLYRRHLEDVVDSSSSINAERYLADLGYVSARKSEPEAVVFADISGYSAISEQEGDRFSASIAATIVDVALDTVGRHRGRLIKMLGDGVMLHFPNAALAVMAAIDLVESAAARGLPPLHVGVDAGPMVHRDGDYFGHTVNTASRLADQAPEMTIYATERVVSRHGGDAFEAIGDVKLKGMSAPVQIYRLVAGT